MRLVFSQTQCRHGGAGFDDLGVSQPANKVFRGIRQLPRDHRPAAEKHQRRTHHALRRMKSWNDVTGTAAISLNQFLAVLGIPVHTNLIAAGFVPADAA